MAQAKINFAAYSSIFAQYFSTISNTNNLYAIFGNKLSGKSVFIDLLTQKEIIQYEDLEVGTTIVVQKGNCEQHYPPIYIQKLKEQLAIESFIPDQSIQSTQFDLETLKYIFLHEFIKLSKKLSFVLVVEQSQKQNIPLQIQRLLYCLGIVQNSRNQNVEIIKQYIYLLMSKTEEELQQTIEMFDDLATYTQNQNVKEVMEYLKDNGHIGQFKLSVPESGYVNEIKQKFELKTYDNELFFNILNESILKDERQPISQEDQVQALKLFEQIIKLINNLVLYASTEEKVYQREYESLAKKLYPDNKKKNQINVMKGKWNKSALGKMSIPAKLASTRKTNQLAFTFIECVDQLLKTFQENSQAQIEFRQLRGRMVYFKALFQWISEAMLQSKIKEIIESFKVAIAKGSETQQKVKTDPKPKAVGRPQKKILPFTNFKQSIEQKCKSNRDAIQLCLTTIKQKEKQEKYDYYDVIYYIKLLKDLLEEFDSEHPAQKQIYIMELLQLAFYTDSYYDFDNYLKIALRNKVMKEKEAISWTKILFASGKYEYSERVTDYLIAETNDNANFERLGPLKANLKVKINEEYQNRQNEPQKAKGQKSQTKKKELTFTFNDLTKKIRGKDLQTFFDGKDYERHTGFKEQS